MSIIPIMELAIGEEQSYGLDWSDELGLKTVTSSTWTVPTGLTRVQQAFTDTTTSVLLQVSTGTLGNIYRVTNRASLSDDQIWEQSIDIKITAK